MATEVTIPTVWDWIGHYLSMPEVWVGIIGFTLFAVAFVKFYRKRRGWY